MDVGGARLHRFGNERIYKTNDRGVILAVQQVRRLREPFRERSEIAVSDTPFEDEPFPASAKTAATVAPVREVRPLPLNKTQFEGKRVPKSQKGEGP